MSFALAFSALAAFAFCFLEEPRHFLLLLRFRGIRFEIRNKRCTPRYSLSRYATFFFYRFAQNTSTRHFEEEPSTRLTRVVLRPLRSVQIIPEPQH